MSHELKYDHDSVVQRLRWTTANNIIPLPGDVNYAIQWLLGKKEMPDDKAVRIDIRLQLVQTETGFRLGLPNGDTEKTHDLSAMATLVGLLISAVATKNAQSGQGYERAIEEMIRIAMNSRSIK